jgi:ABC-2 type transport system permease protein
LSNLVAIADHAELSGSAWLRSELVKVSGFFLRSWRMTRRNAFTLFEIVFWPIVNLLSVGLLITFLKAEPSTVVFVLVGTFALSTVQVCQLDVAYAALFDMWSKSVKHQLVAPIRPWHLVLGSWLMGLVRGTAVFTLQAAVTHWVFGVSVLANGLAPAAALLVGLSSRPRLGRWSRTFGVRPAGEVSAWSGGASARCAGYYPVPSCRPPRVAAGT